MCDLGVSPELPSPRDTPDDRRMTRHQPGRLQGQVIPGKLHLVPGIAHHEVVIRWDSHTTGDNATVISDAKLTEAWRKIVALHVDVPSMAPTFEITARSWSD